MQSVETQIKNQNEKSRFFEKAKQQALKAVNKELSLAEFPEYDQKHKAQIESLQNFPESSQQIRGLDVKYKAIFLKAQFNEQFPENKISVRIERFSGGSAISARWTGPVIKHSETRKLEELYSDRGATDSSIDYFDHDNYCDISEDTHQHIERSKSFPVCAFCGASAEEVAVTSDGKNCCRVCISNQRANSFKVLPKW